MLAHVLPTLRSAVPLVDGLQQHAAVARPRVSRRASAVALVLLAGCAGRYDVFKDLSEDYGADSLEGAQKGPGYLGLGNSLYAGVVGCAGPRYVGFRPPQPGALHMQILTRVEEHPSPITVDILDVEGHVLHTQIAQVSAQAPDSDTVSVALRYEKLATDPERARNTDYVLRITQTGTPCGSLRFVVHFPDSPHGY